MLATRAAKWLERLFAQFPQPARENGLKYNMYTASPDRAIKYVRYPSKIKQGQSVPSPSKEPTENC